MRKDRKQKRRQRIKVREKKEVRVFSVILTNSTKTFMVKQLEMGMDRVESALLSPPPRDYAHLLTPDLDERATRIVRAFAYGDTLYGLYIIYNN